MKKLNFIKESNLWYIDIPEWTGSKAELRMVSGADTLLDVLDTNNNNKVYVEVDTEIFNNFDIKLSKIINVFGGASYMAKSKNFNKPLWLCAVTKYVFGGILPKKIYIKI